MVSLNLLLSLPLATVHGLALLERVTCPPTGAVHMIVVRGSWEPQQGNGQLGSLVDSIRAKIPNSDSESLYYPANLFPYAPSEQTGTANLATLIKSYTAACPNTKIVLLGYSQGAQVVLDTLCGTSEGGDFKDTAAISQAYTKNVIAAVAYGDPSHVPNQPWNVGSSGNSGFFGRWNNAGCWPYIGRLRSYCDSGDPFCDKGFNPFTHGSYFFFYNNDATSFVVSKNK